MNKNLSNFLTNKRDMFKQIVNKLNEKFSYVSLLASDAEGKQLNVSNKTISIKDNMYVERGMVIRVYSGTYYFEYSFDHFESVEEVVNKVLELYSLEDNLNKAIYVKESKYPEIAEDKIIKDFSRMDEFEDIDVEDTINLLKNTIDDSMEEYEYIVNASFKVEYLKISKVFVSTNKNISQVYSWADISYECIVNKDDNTKFNYTGESAISISKAIEKIMKNIKQTNEDAIKLFDSKKIIPGEYECITSPIITGLIAHEAFGHGVEMDMFVKNRAKAKGYINKKVGSNILTMHEGAKPLLDVSSYFFDDEGVLAHDTIEIKNGILKTGIADMLTALKLNIEPTGNGKRESYKRKVYTRMTNTYFEPGTDSLEDMIKSIEYGFLIDVELSGMEDPKNWGIQCLALIGKEIKDGKLTGNYYSPITMTGYVVDLLKSISMLSKEFGLYGNGSCGKGYKEWVKTSIGGPYMKVKVKLG